MAKTFQHANFWAKSKGLDQREWKFVFDENHLRGLDETAIVVVYETAWERDDIDILLATAWNRRLNLHNATV